MRPRLPGDEGPAEVEPEVRDDGRDQAAAGAVVDPGEHDREADDLRDQDRQREGRVPREPVLGEVPERPQDAQQGARPERAGRRLHPGQGEPAPAGLLGQGPRGEGEREPPEEHGERHPGLGPGDVVAEQHVRRGQAKAAQEEDGGGQVPAPADPPAGEPREEPPHLRSAPDGPGDCDGRERRARHAHEPERPIWQPGGVRDVGQERRGADPVREHEEGHQLVSSDQVRDDAHDRTLSIETLREPQATQVTDGFITVPPGPSLR